MADLYISRIFGDDWKNYELQGFSTTVLSDIDQKFGNCSGITWDGANLWETNYTDDILIKHAGWIDAWTNEGAMPASQPSGMTCNKERIFSCDNGTDKIYTHVGFTNSVDSSFDAPASNPWGLCHDGLNLMSCDATSGYVYFHYKETGALRSGTYLAPDDIPLAIGWDGANVIIGAYGGVNNKIYKMIGKTSSVDVSYDTSDFWSGTFIGFVGSITLDDIDVRLSVKEYVPKIQIF